MIHIFVYKYTPQKDATYGTVSSSIVYSILALLSHPPISAQKTTVLSARIKSPLPKRPATEIRAEARLEHLNPSPPNHRRIVSTQVRRRRNNLNMSEPADIKERPQHSHQKPIRRDSPANNKSLDLGNTLIPRFLPQLLKSDDRPRTKMLKADAHRLTRQRNPLLIRHLPAHRLLRSHKFRYHARQKREAELQLPGISKGRREGPAPPTRLLDQLLAPRLGSAVAAPVRATARKGKLFQQSAVHCSFGFVEDGGWEDVSRSFIEGFADCDIRRRGHYRMVCDRGRLDEH